MAKIFTVAQRVLVWLGNHTDCSSELFKFVNRLGPTFSSSFRTPASLINAKNKLFERPYWSRTWVIQELFMARHLIFLCGSSRVDEEHFKRLLRELSAMGPLNDNDKQAILLATARPGPGWGQYTLGRSLVQLISVYWKTNCSNPLDKIYALLGLVRETDKAKSLEIDYSITTLELYCRVIDTMDYPQEAETLRKCLKLQWSDILLAYNRPKRLTQTYGLKDEGLAIPRTGSLERTLFSTRAHSEDDGFWISACNVEPGDKCYSFENRPLAFLFRRETGRFVLVGVAHASVSNGASLP